MRALFTMMATLLIASPCFANDPLAWDLEVGVDFEVPYVLSQAGTSVNEKDDLRLGVHLSQFILSTVTAGVQLDFDIENSSGEDADVFVSPGLLWFLWSGNTIDPYLRVDAPIRITNGADLGGAAGFGLLWDMTDITGFEGLATKVDGSFSYLLDSEVLSVTILRLAFSYYW